MAEEFDKVYWLVNPSGAIHAVDRAHAQERLRVLGWRIATVDEVAKLEAAGFNQRADRPICAPWNPTIEDDPLPVTIAKKSDKTVGIDLTDGVDDAEAKVAGQALKKRASKK